MPSSIKPIAGLAQDGKIISVRLALFAEMMKGKPWTPATLARSRRHRGRRRDVPGRDLRRLDRSLPSIAFTRKPPRRFSEACCPETGTDIKGQMRSRQELLGASGYANRPRDFDDLIHILDP